MLIVAVAGMAAFMAAGCARERAHEEEGLDAGLAHMERAYRYVELGDLDKAMGDLVVAAELMPDSSGPLLTLGDVYEAKGQFQQAVESYRSALALDPNIAVAHFKIGFISKTMRGDNATALTRLSRAVELDSTNATYQFQLADIFHETERFSEAKERFEKAISLNSDHAYAHYGLGEILEAHMGLPEEGFSEFEKAVSIAPTDPNLRRLVGEAYARNGRPREAVRHLQESLRLEPDSPRAQEVRETIRLIESSQGLIP